MKEVLAAFYYIICFLDTFPKKLIGVKNRIFPFFYLNWQ